MEGEKTYMQGFNAGYKLAAYEPELVAKLRPSLKDVSEYEKGVLEGIAQLEKEKGKGHERMNQLKQVRESKDKEKGIER